MHDLPTRWALRHDAPADGVTNMAIDAALLDTVAAGVATWRWYGWESPTVSFGRHERTIGRFDAASCRRAGLDAVRRPTGGRALLHAREVTYSVALPWHRDRPWRAAYRAINHMLVAVLREVGIDASLAAATPPQRDLALCFTAPAEGELIAAGRKLVASAVWRQGDAYLQHGSLLVHDEQARLCDAARVSIAAPEPAATLAALSSALGTADTARAALADALQASLARTEGIARDVTCVAFTPTQAFDDAVVAARQRLCDPAWLWRR